MVFITFGSINPVGIQRVQALYGSRIRTERVRCKSVRDDDVSLSLRLPLSRYEFHFN